MAMLGKNKKGVTMEFKLDTKIKDMKVEGETTYIYSNNKGQWVQITATKTAWTYMVEHCKNIQIKNLKRKFLDSWETNGINQHSFKGGWNEAISKIEIN